MKMITPSRAMRCATLACAAVTVGACETNSGGRDTPVQFAALDFAADVDGDVLQDASALGISILVGQDSASAMPDRYLVHVTNRSSAPIAFLALNDEPRLEVLRLTAQGVWRHVGPSSGNRHANVTDIDVLEPGETRSTLLDGPLLTGVTKLGLWIDCRMPNARDESFSITFSEPEDPARQGYVWSADQRVDGG